MSTQTATTPHLFRCRTCLDVIASETRFISAGVAKCVCGGNLAYVGQVNNGRVIRYDEAPACNYLCTDATGKNCKCQCGGVNHGTHRMRTIKREGDAPTVEEFADADACRARAAELKAATSALRSAVIDLVGQATFDAYRRNEWIERGAWDTLRTLEYTISEAMKLESHQGRLNRLARRS